METKNLSVLKDRILSEKSEELRVKVADEGFVEVDSGRRMPTEKWG